MPYMLLIVEPRGQRQERTLAEGQAAYGQMLAYAGTLKARGVLLGSNALLSDDQAVRVQVRAPERGPSETRSSTVLDGPFSEAKEMIGGYFLVDCATRAEAIAIAEACPAAEWATVEVREVGPCWA